MSWPNLPHPPVVLAVFELRYQTEAGFNIINFLENEGKIRQDYPERVNKVHGDINLPTLTMGVSTAQVSSQQTGYVFLSSDKLRKVTISTESLVFTLEGAYPGCSRTSIRFINRFALPDNDDPTEYFNTVITAAEGVIEGPVDSYFFRYIRSVPDTEIKVIVNNSLEDTVSEMSNFIFDIDVLCHEHFECNLDYLSEKLERIRAEKNEVFFKNITEKTLEIIS